MRTNDPPQYDQPLPYLEITDETYGQLAAQTFTVDKLHPQALLLRGPCPRCGGLVEVPVVTRVFRTHHPLRDALHWGGKRERSADQIEPIVCSCDHDHPHRPDGRFGCGAYWMVVISAGSGAS